MGLFKIQPEFVARPWGQRTLAPLFELPPNVSDPIGEVWLTSEECRIAKGASGESGLTLGELWSQLSDGERGSSFTRVERFPLLVKFIFTAEKLSVQVHPDDEYAKKNEGEPWGKTEAWHILHAEPDAWVKVGFQDGVRSDQVEAAWGKPELERLLNHLPVKAGDTIFVPAGTVHAIGPGLCLCEIQQYSDVTYRVYDYGRLGLDGKPRQLHLVRARDVAQLETPSAGYVTPSSLEGKDRLVESFRFAVEQFEFAGSCEVAPVRDSFDLFVICGGTGDIRNEGSPGAYQPGDTFLRPSNHPALFSAGEGQTTVLQITPRSV